MGADLTGHDEMAADLTTPRSYTARGGWNIRCECGAMVGETGDQDIEQRWEAHRAAVVQRCRHCGDPIRQGVSGYWAHVTAGGSILYNCQHTVPYGQHAEPEVRSGCLDQLERATRTYPQEGHPDER